MFRHQAMGTVPDIWWFNCCSFFSPLSLPLNYSNVNLHFVGHNHKKTFVIFGAKNAHWFVADPQHRFLDRQQEQQEHINQVCNFHENQSRRYFSSSFFWGGETICAANVLQYFQSSYHKKVVLPTFNIICSIAVFFFFLTLKFAPLVTNARKEQEVFFLPEMCNLLTHVQKKIAQD